MIDPGVRAKAVRILRAAAELEPAGKVSHDLADTAKYIGLDPVADFDAIQLASVAWCRLDPEEHGIESSDDVRRDLIAADKLENGWDPEPWVPSTDEDEDDEPEELS